MRDLTIDEIEDALSFISPDLARDDWVRVGMALKAALGEAGFGCFDAWSSGSDKYNKKECERLWRKWRSAGSVGVGTLVHYAKEAGWSLKPDPLSEEDRKRYAQEMAEKRRVAELKAAEEAAWSQRMSDAVAEGCQKLCMWLMDTQDDDQVSPYLERKKVGNHGGYVVARSVVLVVDDKEERSWIVTGAEVGEFFKSKASWCEETKESRWFVKMSPGDFVLPLIDRSGYIRLVQIVFSSGAKKFPRRSEKAGCLATMYGGDDSVWCLAEGYATAASIHEATGRTVFACIDAGNLVALANSIAASNPDKPLLICADDDETTDGKNPGFEFAEKAAAGKNAMVVSPNWGVLPVDVQEAA